MGRSPHKKLFDVDNVHDKEIVHHALEHMGMAHMAKRSYLNLSGGEKQRVLLARAHCPGERFPDSGMNRPTFGYQLSDADSLILLRD